MKPIVVKLGGSTLGAGDTTYEDLASIQKRGQPVVVVHGGGKVITDWLERMGVPTRFEKGLRVTDEEAMQVVSAVLAGLVNKELVAGLIAKGARAIGISGLDGGMLLAQVKDPALGRVGEIVRVDPAPLWKILDNNYIPVVAPLGIDERGQALNINADIAAGELARTLGAVKLVFLTDVPGILDKGGRTLPSLSRGEAERLVKDGVISGGMLPKVEACFRSRCPCLIIDGREPHALLRALEGRAGGTKIEEE